MFVNPWIRTALKKMLAPTTLSQSQYIADLLEQDLIDKGYNSPAAYTSLADLVDANYDLLAVQSKVTAEDLNKIRDGGYCSEISLLRIAMTLDISEDEIRALAQKS
ncbi:MAG: hypothetical protein ACFBSC_21695 [Microcoleaceae cyanobacterium]